MITEHGLHNLAELAFLQVEYSIFERGTHHTPDEPAEIASVPFRIRTFGILCRNFGKIVAGVQSRQYLFDLPAGGVFFGLRGIRLERNENMAGTNFFDTLKGFTNGNGFDAPLLQDQSTVLDSRF